MSDIEVTYPAPAPFTNDSRNEAARRSLDTIATVHDRGRDYGHPLDHHTRTVALMAIVFGGTVKETGGGFVVDTDQRGMERAEDWELAMICDKMARLAHTPDHDDSWRDIAGYVETRFMCADRRAK